MSKKHKSTLGNLEPNMGILPDAKYVCSNYTFWNWEIATRWATHWSHCEMDLSLKKNSVAHLTSMSCYSGEPQSRGGGVNININIRDKDTYNFRSYTYLSWLINGKSCQNGQFLNKI